MEYILISFIAGILTILAPCVLPVIPVVLGGTLENAKDKVRPIIITGSLAASIVIFTLLLKTASFLSGIDQTYWNAISGGIILIFGIITIFPKLWGHIEIKLKLNNLSGNLLQKSSERKGILGLILVGVSLGPVFASCSPTYALILGVILKENYFVGVLNLVVYALGLMIILLVVAILGQRFLSKVKWAIDPDGWFKKLLGILFILLGLAIITGYEKKIETALLDAGFLDVTKIETMLLKNIDENKKNDDTDLNVKNPYDASDFSGIANWINSDPLTMEQLKGKVVLVDFWTYSCINCIRTLPFLTEWDEKYRDEGLVIVGVHTPEFAFEKDLDNVRGAVEGYEIKYPVAMDNDFLTWRAYENRYWPAKYFIDRDGKVRHTHFGEGEYEESEEVIRYLLSEGNEDLNVEKDDYSDYQVPVTKRQSPETYINYQRGTGLAPVNSEEFKADNDINFTLQDDLNLNQWSLGGNWIIGEENTTSMSDNSKLRFIFAAKEVYLVMGSDSETKVKVLLNGEVVNSDNKGDDVGDDGFVTVKNHDLYRLIKLDSFKTDQQIDLEFEEGVKVHAFTFGG